MTPRPLTTYQTGVARKRIERGTKRRSRTGNPLPAALSVLGSLAGGKLGRKLFGAQRYEGGPLMTTVADVLERAEKGDVSAVQLAHRAATSPGAHRVQWAKVWNTEIPGLGGRLPPKIRAEIKRLDPTSPVTSGTAKKAAAAAPPDELAQVLAAAAPVLQTATKTTKPRVQYENFVDPVTGVLKRRKKTPKLSSAGGVGRASVSKLSPAFMRAGVIIGGLAAGYWIGSKLNKYLVTQFGNSAVDKQKAGVAAALAFREARAEAEAAKGAALTSREMTGMATAYKKALVELGYDPVTFTYKRSAVESFFQSQADDDDEE